MRADAALAGMANHALAKHAPLPDSLLLGGMIWDSMGHYGRQLTNGRGSPFPRPTAIRLC